MSATGTQRINLFDTYAVRRPASVDTVIQCKPDDSIQSFDNELTITLHEHNIILQHNMDQLTSTIVQQYKPRLLHDIQHKIGTNHLSAIQQRLSLQSTITLYKQQMQNVLNYKYKHNELDQLIQNQTQENKSNIEYNQQLQSNSASCQVQVGVIRYEQNIIEKEYNLNQQYIWYTQQTQSNNQLLSTVQQQAATQESKLSHLENELMTVLHDYKNKNMTIQHQLLTYDDSAQTHNQYLEAQCHEYSQQIKRLMNEINQSKSQLQQCNDSIHQLHMKLQNKQHELMAAQQYYNDTVQQCNTSNKALQVELVDTAKSIESELCRSIQLQLAECNTSLTDRLRTDLICLQCYELLSQPVLLQPCHHTLCKKCVQPYRIDLTSNTCICNECKTQYMYTMNQQHTEDELFDNHVVHEQHKLYTNPYLSHSTLNETYSDNFTYSDNRAASQLISSYHTCVDTIEYIQPMLNELIQQSIAKIDMQPLIEQLDSAITK